MLPFTALGTEHVHELRAPSGRYYCLDVVWFNGRIDEIRGYGNDWNDAKDQYIRSEEAA